MERVNDEDLTSPEYWDSVYEKERGSGKRRIDDERLQFLVSAIKDWEQKNPYTDKPYQLLDVGCGDGELLRRVHAELPEWKLTGVDITPKTIVWASTVDPYIKFSVASIYDLPSAGTFNVVFCGETLEHLQNPEAAVDSLFTQLADGGYLVCSLPTGHNNYSPEHLNEFTVMDAIKMTTKGDITKLIEVDIKCGGISTIWTTIKR